MPAKPSKQASSRNAIASVTPSEPRSTVTVQRDASGRWSKGFSAQPGGDAGRARKALNLATIKAMQEAFDRGGRKAIDKVMVNAPAQFLKMLVLLVPRELEVTHSGGVKGMSDEQLERGIEALEAIIAKRAASVPGDDALVIDAQVADTPSAPES